MYLQYLIMFILIFSTSVLAMEQDELHIPKENGEYTTSSRQKRNVKNKAVAKRALPKRQKKLTETVEEKTVIQALLSLKDAVPQTTLQNNIPTICKSSNNDISINVGIDELRAKVNHEKVDNYYQIFKDYLKVFVEDGQADDAIKKQVCSQVIAILTTTMQNDFIYLIKKIDESYQKTLHDEKYLKILLSAVMSSPKQKFELIRWLLEAFKSDAGRFYQIATVMMNIFNDDFKLFHQMVNNAAMCTLNKYTNELIQGERGKLSKFAVKKSTCVNIIKSQIETLFTNAPHNLNHSLNRVCLMNAFISIGQLEPFKGLFSHIKETAKILEDRDINYERLLTYCELEACHKHIAFIDEMTKLVYLFDTHLQKFQHS